MKQDAVRLLVAVSLLVILASASGRECVGRASTTAAEWAWEQIADDLPEAPLYEKGPRLPKRSSRGSGEGR